MKVLILGSSGQVGRALKLSSAAPRLKHHQYVFLDRKSLDFRDFDALGGLLVELNPDVIINASAYTDVELAETECEEAIRLNSELPSFLSRYIFSKNKELFIHYSSDYVFDGTKTSAYLESDKPFPINQYGHSKLLGEVGVSEEYDSLRPSRSRYYILRTSWVYGEGRNFIATIFDLARNREEIRVVSDQIGIPTSALWLAELTHMLLDRSVPSGVYHSVNDGKVSWYELAKLIVDVMIEANCSMSLSQEKIQPVLAVDYPIKARRPHNSVLSNQKLKMALAKLDGKNAELFNDDWTYYVKNYVHELIANGRKA